MIINIPKRSRHLVSRYAQQLQLQSNQSPLSMASFGRFLGGSVGSGLSRNKGSGYLTSSTPLARPPRRGGALSLPRLVGFLRASCWAVLYRFGACLYEGRFSLCWAVGAPLRLPLLLFACCCCWFAGGCGLVVPNRQSEVYVDEVEIWSNSRCRRGSLLGVCGGGCPVYRAMPNFWWRRTISTGGALCAAWITRNSLVLGQSVR